MFIAVYFLFAFTFLLSGCKIFCRNILQRKYEKQAKRFYLQNNMICATFGIIILSDDNADAAET